MNLYKYPRTPHLPWSKGITNDDKVISFLDQFEGQEIVITEKMDGENTTMYHDHFHARSVDSRHHPSRDWVKNRWNTFRHHIPVGMRVCGENLYAKHSIAYDNLQSYFYGFSVWDGETCLSWNDTMMYFALLDIVPVPIVYRGTYNRILIESLRFDLDLAHRIGHGQAEGYVIRLARSFTMDEFPLCVAKYVRPNHVETDEHWMHGQIITNKLKEESSNDR